MERFDDGPTVIDCKKTPAECERLAVQDRGAPHESGEPLPRRQNVVGIGEAEVDASHVEEPSQRAFLTNTSLS